MNKDQRLTQIKANRMAYAFEKILRRRLNPQISKNKNYIIFNYRGQNVRIYTFTGWYSGKNIKPGRGIENLINQLK